MQYVRSISGSVSKTWNSINPATLSGAIDVIVVEQENGDLACSPFHVRFGKFSLLRPYEKKVEFRVNDKKTNYSMKLGEGGEAFFVFETNQAVPPDMQTSPLVSPSASPRSMASAPEPTSLQEPDYLNIADTTGQKLDITGESAPLDSRRAQSDVGNVTPLSSSPSSGSTRPASGDWSGAPIMNLERSASEEVLSAPSRRYTLSGQAGPVRPRSPPPLDHAAAVERARALSRKLSISNIQTHITDRGDVMLDMNGYKLDQGESLQAEMIARKILAEELEGDYDIGSLIGADRKGNLWIYSSEEAKEKAGREEGLSQGIDAVSDAGYSSDEARSDSSSESAKRRVDRLSTPPTSPPLPGQERSDSSRNYAKTLRLTSAQLQSLDLKPGPNAISFSVNKATCTAFMYLWKSDVPIVISDIDGTITKSDALGHVLTMIGRDWTHLGVAKLYTNIAANGYHLLYLTSRSVGQADTTRNYLNGIVQEKYKLPKGPVIMSPDRTFSALRREVYLRKPEVFKMACLRDILNLFGARHNPFYAGFGNRLTDALSYRSVNIPSTRIFTINSYAEVSLDLLTLTKYKSSYVNMRDLVDHFFPPVGLLSTDEQYTDFNYWRDPLLDPDEFSDSDDDGEEDEDDEDGEEGEIGDGYYEQHGRLEGKYATYADEEDEYDEYVEGEEQDEEDEEEGEEEEDEDGEEGYEEESLVPDIAVDGGADGGAQHPGDVKREVEEITDAAPSKISLISDKVDGMKMDLDAGGLIQSKELIERGLDGAIGGVVGEIKDLAERVSGEPTQKGKREIDVQA